ncbi:MAG: TIGR00701 family protein [Micavibrio sp.]|nr:TIGR00701 family protein [Micavibrio sp.]|tara:strand:+ start:671 stop:1117 length:447 start_codon:yes stop_codon:yes gene_type:complete
MHDILLGNYEWLRALHIISVMAWMAGMLYLPRLYVYHADTAVGSETSEQFKVMERRLLRFIINPAMIASLLFGVLMFVAIPAMMQEGWMHLKLTAIILMFAAHGVLAKHRRLFDRDERVKSAKYYRILNEIPTVLMIIIVIAAVVQPF